ncbi:4-aminobutyrate--2-oxoglutarate transaminase [Bradyrhizobium zhanjiangense]|uniref:4-aminobutyrate--2-oxoglutarate transaminase n=1 Tax=Bradyrhizobium zhanjiangense TaxID=1325107 RepID=A0ABY0DB01_9BRAD|nr:4-aminobutyrate--2-oxoglutarate transaminase [Bradyrhizobium zhanjiangense]RXG86634.1 4-aminobutyrate--2-oxoglutarate transaminase [Bradyrhizobium zhanjiangense]
MTVKSTKNAEVKNRKEAATPRGQGTLCSIYAARAENAQLWDIEGRRFIDFVGGVAVLNTGHRHPKILAAIREQLDRFTHTCYGIVPYPSYVELAEKINHRAPGNFPKKTAFFTTGVEAVENAIKIARVATGRLGVIAFANGFHGRSLFGTALTGMVAPHKLGLGAFPPGVFHAPYPNPLHGVSTADSLRAIEFLFKADIDPKCVAAIIMEPVQGDGGFYVAPSDFVRGLRKICDDHGILLIADEVQTGFARTGKLFAMQHHDVIPDLTTTGKSLAGGMPLSGVVGSAEIMDALAPGGLGGTFAGNPLAIAAAHAVLDIIDEECLCERATSLGERLKAKLTAVGEHVPEIAEVRGLGGMIAVEFCEPSTREPDAELARSVIARALERGLLLLYAGVDRNVIRFLFPLTIEDAVFDEALGILDEVFKESVGSTA